MSNLRLRWTMVWIATMLSLALARPLSAATIGSAAGVSSTTTLNGVACADANDCYAVGANSSQGVLVPIINGSAGSAIGSSLFLGITSLNAIACPSSSVCWVAGSNGSLGIVERLGVSGASVSGGGFSNSSTEPPSLSGIACVSTTVCYAVGQRTSPLEGAVIAVDSSSLLISETDDTSAQDLLGIACPSSSACYAAGFDGTIQAIVQPLGVSDLTVTPGTANGAGLTSFQFNGIACLNTTTCYVAGDNGAEGQVDTVTSGVPTTPPTLVPGTTVLSGIVCPSGTLCYAVGSGTTTGAVVLVVSGAPGSASNVASTSALNGVACASSTTCWAVGTNGTNGVVVPLTNQTVVTTQLSSMSIKVGGSVTDSASLGTVTADTSGLVTYNIFANGCTTLATGSQVSPTSSTVSVSGGTVPNSAPFTFAQTGTYHFQAAYGGDATDNAATATCSTTNAAETLTVVPRTTSTTVTCTPNSGIVVGTTTTCTATVSDNDTDLSEPPSAPGGTVNFTTSGSGSFSNLPAGCTGSGGNVTCPLSSGTCSPTPCNAVSVTYTPATTAATTISGAYTSNDFVHGNSSCSGGCAALGLTTRSTSTTVTCSPSAVPINSSSTCTATVSDLTSNGGTASAPGGTVTFSIGAGSSGTGSFSGSGCTPGSGTSISCPLGSGTCTPAPCNVASLTYTPSSGAGTHNIVGTYNPNDSVHATSDNTGSPFALTVRLRNTSTGVSCSPASLSTGSTTICTATVSDTDSPTTSAPAGTVAFSNNGATGTFSAAAGSTFTPPATCTLAAAAGSSAKCSVTYTSPVPGPQTISTTYSPGGGDTVHAGSSGQVALLVATSGGGGAFGGGGAQPTPIGTPSVTPTPAPTHTPGPTGGTPSPTPTATSGCATVTYAAGYNLAGGPSGTVLNGAAGSLFTFQAGDSAYQTLPVTASLSGGVGVWAFFFTPTTVTLPCVGKQTQLIVLPVNHFIMVANPGDTPATVSGADLVDTFNPATNTYTTVTGTATLAPGQGAWVFSRAGGSLTIVNQ